jgi:hypothetical protein
MKKTVLSCTLALVSGLSLADSTGRDVTSAVQKLGDVNDYAWHSVFTDPADSQSVSADGQTANDGFIYVDASFGGSSSEFVTKGGMVVITDQAGAWQPLGMLDTHQEANRFSRSLVRNLKTPAAQAAELAAAVATYKKDGEAYYGDLTDNGANRLLSFGGNIATNSSGSVKFWITDGNLTHYEFKVKGTVSSGGADLAVSRDASVDIKNIGTTKVTMPNEARHLLP